jgi:hypothetical protein
LPAFYALWWGIAIAFLIAMQHFTGRLYGHAAPSIFQHEIRAFQVEM